MTYVAINIYFQGDYLILDQSSYMEKAYQRMKEGQASLFEIEKTLPGRYPRI